MRYNICLSLAFVGLIAVITVVPATEGRGGGRGGGARGGRGGGYKVGRFASTGGDGFFSSVFRRRRSQNNKQASGTVSDSSEQNNMPKKKELDIKSNKSTFMTAFYGGSALGLIQVVGDLPYEDQQNDTEISSASILYVK